MLPMRMALKYDLEKYVNYYNHADFSAKIKNN